MKIKATRKRLTLPVLIITGTVITIIFLLILSGVISALILSETIKPNYSDAINKILLSISVFLGCKIVTLNKKRIIAAVIYTGLICILITIVSLLIKINTPNILFNILFILLGSGLALFISKNNRNKKHFVNKRYR